MSKEEVYERLNNVFRDVFDDENIVVKPETTSNDIEDWDSLEHINLIVAIKFNMGEVTTMKNVGEMVDIILSRVG